MASSSTESAGSTRRVVIEPYEILWEAPKNRRVRHLEIGEDKNKRPYPILVYYNNDKLAHDGQQKAVCYYNNQWCTLGYDKQLGKSLAGKPLPEIQQYDEETRHYYSDIPPVAHYYCYDPRTRRAPIFYFPRALFPY